jgi:hypothetical protein
VEVEGTFVSRANFSGTTNGARIKTWPGCLFSGAIEKKIVFKFAEEILIVFLYFINAANFAFIHIACK